MVPDGLVSFAEADWIALWMIVDGVESELSLRDDQEILDKTISLVEGLAGQGLLAGASPAVLRRG